ncbi:MAG: cysteine methyltransferase, partial [Reyranellales bacterium]
MTARGFILFETPIGTCGLAWGPNGIMGLQLPEESAAKTRGRLQRRWPEAIEQAPPADVQRAIDQVLTLLTDGT